MHDAAAHEEEEAEKIQEVGQAPAAVQEEQVGNRTQHLILIPITRRRRWRLSRLTVWWLCSCTTPTGCISPFLWSCLCIIQTEMNIRLGGHGAAVMALWWFEAGFLLDQAATSIQVVALIRLALTMFDLELQELPSEVKERFLWRAILIMHNHPLVSCNELIQRSSCYVVLNTGGGGQWGGK